MSFGLQRNAFGRLVLTDIDGVAHEGVVPVRAFPIAAPGEGLSLLSAEGHELVWIDRLGDLSPPQRELVDEELVEPRVRARDPPRAGRQHLLRPPVPGAWTPTVARHTSCSRARKTSDASAARCC